MTNEMKPIKCVVVGAGATGSMVSCFLKRLYKQQISLELWDKGRGAGGRMSSSRYGDGSSLSLDLGAQYISATKDYQVKHKNLYEELLSNGVLAPLSAKIEGMRGESDTKHYVTPTGINSIPKYFLQQSDSQSKFQTTLNEVNVTDTSSVTVFATASDGQVIQQNVDALVITMPIPQLLNLGGDIRTLIDPFRTKLSDVVYSSRFALGMFYKDVSDIPEVDWASKYIRGNPCLCFVSIDTKKRLNGSSSDGSSIVAHASVPFSLKNLEKTFAEIEPIMTEHVMKEIPSLPKPDKTRVIRWRYSQVSTPYENAPGCIVLSREPLIVCAGDAFAHSNFDGCADSATSVVECFRDLFPLGHSM